MTVNEEICPYDHDAAEAARTGVWTSGLRAHVEGCAECTEMLDLVAPLRRAAGQWSAGVNLPASYRILWLRGVFSRRQQRLSRLDRLILLSLFGTMAGALLGTLWWKWGAVQQWITGIVREPGTSVPLYVVAGCVALVWFLAEDVFLAGR